MKNIIVATVLLLSGSFSDSIAQNKTAFEQFARTKDSLINIAYYDNDMPQMKRLVNEFVAGYNKLSPKDQETYKDDAKGIYYNLACFYAIKGDKATALVYLKKSGFSNYNHLLTDSDLNNIRKEPEFIKYLAEVKKHPTEFQSLLQHDTKYQNIKTNLPTFTYQSADNEQLVALKKKYNLDSIAGDGDDIARIINLMKWVHYLIPHDGSKGNPDKKNAMSMITECKKDNKTLNCRGLAIVLNEVYLATGFKSKFVTCLPKDTADNDCHVINIVWSASLNKWIWMDPTFMAYVMNEEGELLSIEETRDRLVHNKPLLLNADANRNHGGTQEKSWYLGYYMSKNLYRLECPVNSQYNYETKGEGKARAYVQLIPHATLPPAEQVKDKHGVATYTLTYTNNPADFWAAPEVAKVRQLEKNDRTQADYENVVARFKDFYNNGKADSLANLFSSPVEMKPFAERVINNNKDLGSLISFKFMSMELDNKYEHDALFKMVYEKSVHCMAISLDSNNKLGTFRFKTTSPYIDYILSKNK